MRLFFILLYISFLITGCTESNNSDKGSSFIFHKTELAIIESKEGRMFSVNWVMENLTDQSFSPIYAKLVFANDVISELIGSKESQINIDLEIKANETRMFGDNLKIAVDKNIDVNQIKEIVEKENAVQVHIMNEKNELIASKWLHHFEYVKVE